MMFTRLGYIIMGLDGKPGIMSLYRAVLLDVFRTTVVVPGCVEQLCLAVTRGKWKAKVLVCLCHSFM